MTRLEAVKAARAEIVDGLLEPNPLDGRQRFIKAKNMLQDVINSIEKQKTQNSYAEEKR